MATATVTQEATSGSSLPYSISNETYRAYVKPDAAGKVDSIKVLTAGKDGAGWKQAEADGYVLGTEQTFKMYRVNSVDAAVRLIENDEELVNIINKGLNAKTIASINQALKKTNDDDTQLKWEPTDGAFDTIDFLQEESQRRNLSPVEKATKLIRQLLRSQYPNASEEDLTTRVQLMMTAMQS